MAPSPQQQVLERIRPFAITYALISLPRVLRLLVGNSKTPFGVRLKVLLTILLRPSASKLKLAAFPAILPLVYQTIRPHITSEYASEIAVLLSSPVSLLLPHGLRLNLALYTLSSALSTFLKSASPKAIEAKAAAGDTSKDWRDYLPPVTILNALGNSWMLWSWYRVKGVFPKSYEALIRDHSPHYCPPSRHSDEIRDFLEVTLNPRIPNPTPGGHQYVVCQTLHPNEPSCTKNYFIAWADCAPIVIKWVSGFGALTTLLGFKGRILSDPIEALKSWLEYTIRGTLYVTGSVQTVWAVICVLQRLFPGDFLPKLRWVINGSIASLWIYALPHNRRKAISVYVGRLAALSMWRAWLRFGGWSLKYGEVLIFAVGWNFLLQLRAGGWHIEGLMRKGIKFIEGKPLEPTPTPPPSSLPSEANLTTLQRSKDSYVSIADSGFSEYGVANMAHE